MNWACFVTSLSFRNTPARDGETSARRTTMNRGHSYFLHFRKKWISCHAGAYPGEMSGAVLLFIRVVTSRNFSDLSTLNSFSDQNRLLNRFFLQVFLTILSSLSTAILLNQGRISQFLSGNLPFWHSHTMAGVTYKRINSLKKELTIHNSFEKELIESILQLSTPDSLPL